MIADPHISLDADRAAPVAHVERVIAAAYATGVDAVLIAGDLTRHGQPAEFERHAQLIERFHARAWMVPGNHDVGPKPLPNAEGSQKNRPRQGTEQRPPIVSRPLRVKASIAGRPA